METTKNKILLIDDDPVQIESLSEMLEHLYNIESLNSGLPAIEKVKSFKPDLILLDITMPDMDGFEICRSLKAENDLKDIPIIFCSSRFKLEDKIKGFESGGVDYITKPFEIEEIMARLNTHIQLRNALQVIDEYNHSLEIKIQKQTQELLKAERNATFSLMVKGIVHNLKSPLACISINANTIKTKLLSLKGLLLETDSTQEIYDDIDKILSYLKLSSSSCENMDNALNMLMTKSYTEKKNRIMKFDLNKLLNNEIDCLTSNLKFTNNIRKEVKLDAPDLFMKVVPAEIIQVFHNLMNNAIDEVSEKKDAMIKITAGKDFKQTWFSVSDNGDGIKEENISRIFDPFFTTKPEKEERTSGLGLGLHFCAQIINSYDGKIKVKKNELGGACFTVSIPYSD